jgi:hypothetical protein
MLTVAEHTVEVSAVVARPLVAVALVLLKKLRALGVLLCLVVLLSILDEAALSVKRRSFVISLEALLDRLSRCRLVELLDESCVSPLAVLPFRMLLRARRSLSSLAHVVMVSTGS